MEQNASSFNYRNSVLFQSELLEEEKYTISCQIIVKNLLFSVSKKVKATSLQTTQRGIGIPPYWAKMEISDPFKRVPLSPDARGMIKMEYDEVAEKFKKTMKQATILQIERVQNIFCWEAYQL